MWSERKHAERLCATAPRNGKQLCYDCTWGGFQRTTAAPTTGPPRARPISRGLTGRACLWHRRPRARGHACTASLLTWYEPTTRAQRPTASHFSRRGTALGLSAHTRGVLSAKLDMLYLKHFHTETREHTPYEFSRNTAASATITRPGGSAAYIVCREYVHSFNGFSVSWVGRPSAPPL